MPQVLIAEEIKVTVSGMVCSFCAQGIKKNLMKVPGVKEVIPNLADKTVLIYTDEAVTVTDPQIATVINDAGYGILETSRSSNEKVN